MSHDEKSITAPRRFLIDVEETIRVVLEQEDTDGDFQISVTDAGPKLIPLGTATSNGFKTFDIRVRLIHMVLCKCHLMQLATIGQLYAVQLVARIGSSKRP